jgi:hypothetical protein
VRLQKLPAAGKKFPAGAHQFPAPATQGICLKPLQQWHKLDVNRLIAVDPKEILCKNTLRAGKPPARSPGLLHTLYPSAARTSPTAAPSQSAYWASTQIIMPRPRVAGSFT